MIPSRRWFPYDAPRRPPKSSGAQTGRRVIGFAPVEVGSLLQTDRRAEWGWRDLLVDAARRAPRPSDLRSVEDDLVTPLGGGPPRSGQRRADNGPPAAHRCAPQWNALQLAGDQAASSRGQSLRCKSTCHAVGESPPQPRRPRKRGDDGDPQCEQSAHPGEQHGPSDLSGGDHGRMPARRVAIDDAFGVTAGAMRPPYEPKGLRRDLGAELRVRPDLGY